MPIVTLADVKSHLGVTLTTDDSLIEAKIESAQAHLESLLGYAIEDEFETVPADLKEAVRLLAAHWFENREASVVGVSVSALPIGLLYIVSNRRNYSWGDPDGEE